MLSYFVWHYSRGLKNYFIIWRNFIEFFWQFFSVPLLAGTLFSRWRRDVNVHGRGFDPQEFLETLTLNLLSRIIGAIIKTVVIGVALAFEFFIIFGGLILFFIWFLLPVIIFYLLFSGVLDVFNDEQMILGAVRLAITPALICLAWLCFALDNKKLPSQMTLAEMMKENWFDLVWLRAGAALEKGRYLKPETLSEVLKENKLSEDDFKEIILWVVRQEERELLAKRFWRRENLLNRRGIGKDWAFGYTVTLDRFSVDLGAPQSRKFKSYLIGRESEIEQIERILVRSAQNNILIVGEPGTGRKTVVKGFADFVTQGKVLAPLKHKRVMELNIGALVAGAANTNEIEARLRLILKEAEKAGNIILVIDDFHNFVGVQGGLGKIDISSLIAPYLNSKKVQLICITSYAGLHKNIEASPGLIKLFEKIEIKEPDEKQTLQVLEDLTPKLEQKIGVLVSFPALKEIVFKAGQYFGDVPMPERAVDLLDETMVYVATKKGGRILKVEDVDFILSEKTEIPIGELAKEEKEKLANLENILHRRVVGQDEAVKSVASAMRRARLGIGEKKRPIGTFLFLGPTGVGKTETAKALAEAYFGQEEKMIRFDMSEYQNTADLGRLIGTPQGEPGNLVTQVRENPFSLLLLDEIEKAHPNILNLFLQILDEGLLTDAWGRKVNFRNTIIVSTSNAGAEIIRQEVAGGANLTIVKEKLLDFVQRQGIFRPEFLNRFDGIIIYQPLSRENLVLIAKLLLGNLAKRLAEQEINFIVSDALAAKIAELGYAPEFGARPMRRVIQDKIEDLISQRILAGEIQKGQSVEIRPEEI